MKRTFDFNANLKRYIIGSGIVFAVILLFTIINRGAQLDIQFSGGSIVTYSYDGSVDHELFESIVTDELGGASVQQSEDVVTGAETVIINLAGERSLSADELVEVTNRLQTAFPDNNVHTLEISNVDPTIGSEFLAKCICALILAVALVLCYVAYRFRRIGGLSAGAMGVVALLHDCVIVFGVFVIFRMPIDSNFIAVILTILGYSLNDTIVIYDRIRENKQLHGSKMDVGEMVNTSVNQSLRRTINTSVTTIMSMLVVTIVALMFGVSSILSFSFPLIIGLASGTYSSTCLAGPLWVRWQQHKLQKKAA